MMRKQGAPRKMVTSNRVKVLLVADIAKTGDLLKDGSSSAVLGWFGDVVEVSSGFARNYLLPRGLAVVPTDAAIKSIAQEKTGRAEARRLQSQKLEETAAAVNGAEVVIAAKTNEAGLLFGSVGSREIAANLREQGFEVADEMVQLSEHIKQAGTTAVKIKFAQDLIVAVNVVVIPQQDEAGRSVFDIPEQKTENGNQSQDK